MAKVKYTLLLEGHAAPLGLFSESYSLELAPSDEEQATYVDSITGTQMILRGSDFEYDGETMTAGKITSVILADEEDSRYVTYSKGAWSAEAMMEIFAVQGFYYVERYLLKGKDEVIGTDGADTLRGSKGRDTILGKGGYDWIYGDEGDDRVTGGGGSDQFNFFDEDGRDVITDFDADGGGKKQDYLRLQSGIDYNEKHTKDGLLLKFETGDTLLLLDVDKLDKNDVSFL